jgi:hypothetical protein
MADEVTIFNKVNRRLEFNYSGAQIAKWSGLETSLISRFLNGKSDISVSKFLQLIRSMPPEFQQAYWSELLEIETKPEELGSWRSLIARASYEEVEEILNAVADRWAGLGKAKERELVKA